MTQVQKTTFKVNPGSAARLVAAIALATFGCANYAHGDDTCNQTYDTNTIPTPCNSGSNAYQDAYTRLLTVPVVRPTSSTRARVVL